MWKSILSFAFILVAVGLLFIYWFVPFREINFGTKSSNSNFSIDNLGNMQFYDNMRYPNSGISYRIGDECSLQKKNDMEEAFKIISDASVLSFYSVGFGEEISVTCDEKNKVEGGLFIAGEGGPTNITKAGEFNVILNGKVLLIKDSSCPNPNIAIHELLHALGFEHSFNPKNIMYYVSKCEQTIGQDTIDLINKIYSFQSYPDLILENVSAVMKGKYLDANITVRNNGLKDSENSKIIIYADDKLVKEIYLEPMKIGFGVSLKLNNVWILKINVNELKFFIDYNFEELNKENNEVILTVSA